MNESNSTQSNINSIKCLFCKKDNHIVNNCKDIKLLEFEKSVIILRNFCLQNECLYLFHIYLSNCNEHLVSALAIKKFQVSELNFQLSNCIESINQSIFNQPFYLNQENLNNLLSDLETEIDFAYNLQVINNIPVVSDDSYDIPDLIEDNLISNQHDFQTQNQIQNQTQNQTQNQIIEPSIILEIPDFEELTAYDEYDEFDDLPDLIPSDHHQPLWFIDRTPEIKLPRKFNIKKTLIDLKDQLDEIDCKICFEKLNLINCLTLQCHFTHQYCLDCIKEDLTRVSLIQNKIPECAYCRTEIKEMILYKETDLFNNLLLDII